VQKYAFLGLVALVAGIVVGGFTLFSRSASSTSAATDPTQIVTTQSQVEAQAFLATPLPAILAATVTAAPSATATPVPPTATPLPPTATPTVAPPVKTGSAPPPNVTAWSIAVVDQDSGQLLYGRDPHRHLAPASLTKIFTALVALEQGGDLQRQVTVHFDRSELVDSTLMGIHNGETYSMQDLLYGLMLPSGNDAALAIADNIGGNEANFANMMNAEAAKLGLHDSHFVDAHGLDRPNHYSSTYDLAMAARYGMMNFPEFRTLVKARLWTVHGTRTWTVYNLNRFLWSYPGADGVKIGYTDNSGHAIVASATRNGHRVFVALIHCGDIVNDSVPLFNWVFNNFTWPASTATPTPSTVATPTPSVEATPVASANATPTALSTATTP